jgi:hypothetical protein
MLPHLIAIFWWLHFFIDQKFEDLCKPPGFIARGSAAQVGKRSNTKDLEVRLCAPWGPWCSWDSAREILKKEPRAHCNWSEKFKMFAITQLHTQLRLREAYESWTGEVHPQDVRHRHPESFSLAQAEVNVDPRDPSERRAGIYGCAMVETWVMRPCWGCLQAL